MIAHLLFLLVVAWVAESTPRSNTCISQDAQIQMLDTQRASFTPIKNAKWAIVALARFGKADVRSRNEALAKNLRPYADKHNLTVMFFGESPCPPSLLTQWKKTLWGILGALATNHTNLAFTMFRSRSG